MCVTFEVPPVVAADDVVIVVAARAAARISCKGYSGFRLFRGQAPENGDTLLGLLRVFPRPRLPWMEADELDPSSRP